MTFGAVDDTETSTDDGDSPSDDDAGDSGDGDGDGDGDTSGGTDTEGDGDGDPSHDPDAEEDEPCVSISQAATLHDIPADIIFVVDNSGSMEEEAEFVRAQLNDFSAQIQMSGIDHHVVLISSYPNKNNGHGICIDPPLGGGGCPDDDNNLPIYRHVDKKINSHDALVKLLATHVHWQDSIRPDSIKHIVVISDDESELGPDIFENQLKALDPIGEDFFFHAIVCPYMCGEAAAVGQVYMDLVTQTGGVLGDLCLQDFQTVFDQLAESVIQNSPLSCEFEIPEPPQDMALDPDKVNVEIEDGTGNLEEIPRVMDADDCVNWPHGWHYDDPVNPTQIFLCPQTCEAAQGYAMGSINVKFGCDTYVPVE